MVIYISGNKWLMAYIVLKSHRNKMGIIYMQSWKQCTLSVITTMALWQLMHLDMWCMVYIHMYVYTQYIYIYNNLPVNAIVRLPILRKEIARARKRFQHPLLTSRPPTMTQCSNYYSFLSTLRSKGLSHSKIKWWHDHTHLRMYTCVYVCVYIYIYIYIYTCQAYIYIYK